MNERNVAALEVALSAAIPRRPHEAITGESVSTLREVAEALAARGVLVPSALTYRDWFRLPGKPGPGMSGSGDMAFLLPEEELDAATEPLRAELERIAKGDR